jgi:phosphatidylinositol phospholipase C delta
MNSESLTSRLVALNPFSRTDENDEQGEEISASTVAGGGQGARRSATTKSDLRVSHALKSFLVENKVLKKEDDTWSLRALLEKPHIEVPIHLTDRSHPLPEYFIASSHNTYLKAHQLFGSSSADVYATVLNAGSRCVEIDAWDNDKDLDEPKVTHGYTLVSNISFRSVCEIMRDYIDKEVANSVESQGCRSAPILLSLENHCGTHGQARLVQIMTEVWGNRVLSEAVRKEGHAEQDGGAHVLLSDLGSKIVVIVEHHLGSGVVEHDNDDSDDDDDDNDELDEKEARIAYAQAKKDTSTTNIIPMLADLGVYAQSVKPTDNSWYDQPPLKNRPHHHLINVSETGLIAHMPTGSQKIGQHNAHHLMRVYPKGTRISSKNLNPVPFWGVGAQICALNWQTFGAGMQLNEALFSGSDGYVLKPAALRTGGDGKLSTGRKKTLRLHIAGASAVPVPESHDAEDIKPYVSCMLIHPDDLEKSPPKRKTSPYKHHKLGFLHRGENSPLIDPVWDEILEWEYEDNELVFLRLLIKSDDSFATNPVFAVAAVRVLYVTSGWSFLRMLDLKGEETPCSLLVKFIIEDR